MFKPIPQVDQLAVHFQLDGNLIHKDSEEAKRQLQRDAAGNWIENFNLILFLFLDFVIEEPAATTTNGVNFKKKT